MSGLLRRLRRRGSATADEHRSPTAESSEPAAAPADAPDEPGGDRPVPADEQRTQVIAATGEQTAAESPGAAWATSDEKPKPEQPTASDAKPITSAEQPTTSAEQPTTSAGQPVPVRVRDLPAGVDAGDLSSGPTDSARRGKLRRRLRYLRRVRELLLRDLGGFTYEIHRTAGGAPQEIQQRLSESKAKRISALDAEVAAIESRLGEPHADPVLREAGIGGTCPECGELHASEAHYCFRCGTPLDAKARAQREAVVMQKPAPEPPPAAVLWAGGPRPSRGESEPDRPSAETSQWLIGDRPTAADRPAADEPAAAAGGPAVASDEPATADEPRASDDPAAASDPAMADDKSAAATDEPVTTANERVAGDEPVATDEPKASDEPPSRDETPATDEPKAGAEPPAHDEPPAADELAAGEPAAADEPPAADEPAAAGDEPPAAAGDDAPAAEADDAKASEKFEPGPNGRRNEDVPRPVRSRDPLTSRRDQTP